MTAAKKISMTVTPEMAEALRESVEAGDYASTSDALRDAVRIWRRDRDEQADRLDLIRARIRRSIDDPRPSLSSDEVRRWLKTLHDETVKADEAEAL